MLRHVQLTTQETEEAPRLQIRIHTSGVVIRERVITIGGDNVRHPDFSGIGAKHVLGFARTPDVPQIQLTWGEWYFGTGRVHPEGMYLVCADHAGWIFTLAPKIVGWEVLA